MLLATTKILLDRDGSEIQFNGKPLSVSIALCTALDNPSERITFEEKVKRFKLACKIYDEPLIEVTVEEASLLQKVVNEFFSSPLVVVPIYNLIEDASKIQKPKNGADKDARVDS